MQRLNKIVRIEIPKNAENNTSKVINSIFFCKKKWSLGAQNGKT